MVLSWGIPAQFVAYKRTTHLYPSRIGKWGPDPTLAGGSCWSLWRVMLVMFLYLADDDEELARDEKDLANDEEELVREEKDLANDDEECAHDEPVGSFRILQNPSS